MKRSILILLLLLSACSDKKTKSPEPVLTCSDLQSIGNWVNTADPNDELTINSNCAGELSGTCQTEFNFTMPDENGIISLEVTLSHGVGCLGLGTYTCATSVTEPHLQLNCGLGLWVYERN